MAATAGRGPNLVGAHQVTTVRLVHDIWSRDLDGPPRGLGCDVGLPDGDPAGWPQQAFEFTAWNGSSQVRWIKGVGSHKADAPASAGDIIESSILLWGTASGRQAHGWTAMESPRIGSYPIPLEVTEGNRARLVVHEHLGEDSYGRAAVDLTLWVNLEVAS